MNKIPSYLDLPAYIRDICRQGYSTLALQNSPPTTSVKHKESTVLNFQILRQLVTHDTNPHITLMAKCNQL